MYIAEKKDSRFATDTLILMMLLSIFKYILSLC